MHMVRANGDRCGLPHDVPLIGEQAERHADGNDGHRYAAFRRRRGVAAGETECGTLSDGQCGYRDQYDLEKPRQRLRLAMAETMVIVGRLRGIDDAE